MIINEKPTDYVVSPYVHGKTADKICRTCKYCQKIQSNNKQLFLQ